MLQAVLLIRIIPSRKSHSRHNACSSSSTLSSSYTFHYIYRAIIFVDYYAIVWQMKRVYPSPSRKIFLWLYTIKHMRTFRFVLLNWDLFENSRKLILDSYACIRDTDIRPPGNMERSLRPPTHNSASTLLSKRDSFEALNHHRYTNGSWTQPISFMIYVNELYKSSPNSRSYAE